MAWQPIETMPDATPESPIMRWHKVWNVALTVFRNRNPSGGPIVAGACEWIVRDMSISWPEDAFSKHWRKPIKGPKESQQ